MVKKISSSKDLELDQMQMRVKAFEGEFVYVQVNAVSLLSICAYAAHRKTKHRNAKSFTNYILLLL